jgi:tungstate transport system substrate-binding protein
MKIHPLACTLVIGLFGLMGSSACQAPPSECDCNKRSLRVSSTTSVDNTGLWAELQKAFTKKTGIRIQILAVGTGKAIKLAANGDVDALLVHDRAAELAFLAQGHGLNHIVVMKNDFVIVGPKADPAGIKGMDAAEALSAIAGKQSPFVSRGDDSGTHKAEKRLWRAAGVEPAGEWYLEAGQGMRLTVTVADQKQAYCMTDRATYLVAADKVELQILVEGDPRLHNPYAYMTVDPKRHPKASYTEAMALAGYLGSPEGQAIIAGFKVEGQTLFIPVPPTNK